MPSAIISASRWPEPPLGARRARGGQEAAIDRGQRQVGEPGAEEEQLDAAEGAARLGGELQALERGVDGEEREQADRERHQHPDPVRLNRRIAGRSSIPSATGITPT